MSDEAVFRTLQLGRETTFGTYGTATTVFACDPGSGEFSLNRATEVPDEDYGHIARNHAGRGSHGVRIATASLSAPLRFEDVGHIFDMALGTADTTGSGTYTHVWTGDNTSDTIKSYSIETTSGVQDWVAKGVVVTGFEIGFDAIGAGQNAMWTVSADLQAADLSTGTATASLTPPTALETAEGHLTTLSEGPVGTAFASLTALSGHLVSYRLRVDCPKPLRPYGSSSDVASAKGTQKRLGTVSALVKVSASAVSDFWDIYNVSGGLVTDRRWRIDADGAGDNDLKIDHRLTFKDVHIEPDGRDGERLMAIEAETTMDSTLASDLQITIVNLVSALP